MTLWVHLDRTYFAKIENWKHCNKVIFKCVNSVMGPIFNEKVTEKWSLWVHEQCTGALFTGEFVNNCGWNTKKKKAENVDVDVYPNPHYINALSLDHSYFMSTLRPWNHYWKSCMKESVAVIWEEGPYHIGLSLEDTDGRICRKRPKIMLRSMTSVKGSPRASINLEAHWILFLVHGHLHNGVST